MTHPGGTNAKKGNGLLVWLTGLSGAGKSSLAQELGRRLMNHGVRSFILDGDQMRQGLCSDLGFTVDDRVENVRRIGEVARFLVLEGCVVIAACISPIRTSRDAVRLRIPAGQFIEVYLNCPLSVCMRRDHKGIYAKALANQMQDFTGLTSPYEPPVGSEIELLTDKYSVDECAAKVMNVVLPTFGSDGTDI